MKETLNNAEPSNSTKPVLANRLLKFRIFDKNIPTYSEVMEDKEPSGQMLYDMDYLLNSDYFKHALEGKYPIMQFIGMHDKNGKEIYEGDIILCNTKKGRNVFTIEYVDFFTYIGFRMYGLNRRFHTPITHSRISNGSIEIIGNVFENPELLKST